MSGNGASDTALHLAADAGHFAVAQMLLEYGANIDLVDSSGRRPLERALQNGHHDVLDLLRQVCAVCLCCVLCVLSTVTMLPSYG